MKSRRECNYTRDLDLETLDSRDKLPAVEPGWAVHMPALPVAAGGGVVSTADFVKVSKGIAP